MASTSTRLPPADSRLAAAVDEVLRAAERDQHFSGAVCLSRDGTELLEQGYGVASRRWGVPVSPATRFDTASVTKLFTAVAVLQQVEAGRLGLDTAITDVVDLTGTTISPDVTIRHLLTHTSGIADDADEEAGESYEELWLHRPSHTVTETADFLPQFAYKPPRTAPGTDCRYCNVGYILAGLALERVTGTRYRDYVTEHVFARAGMAGAGFFDMRAAVADVAEGWDPVDADGRPVEDPATAAEWRANIYSYPPIGSPDGGAHATARDLVTFLDAVRGGRLLGPELTEEFLTAQVLHDADDDRELHYGYGLELVVVDGRLRRIAKDGINAGASALVQHVVAPGITLALLSNSADGAWGPARAIGQLIG